jgi:formylglycine-generating enzyme required for sulfatase activity
LRQWKREDWLKKVSDEWIKDKEGRDKRLKGIRQLVQKGREKAPPQWYVNGEGQTMVVLPGPVEFTMGSPPDDAERYPEETPHRRRIGRTFAIAAKPVTVDEYRRYNKSYAYLERYAPKGDCPVVQTSWYQAAAYCNWLSDREGLEKCYEDDGKGTVTKLKGNYLRLSGYRLPTEAEWEYACRAGAVTSRYYGVSVDLLDNFGRYIQNSHEHTWPVGGKKPNDFGLFDLHGNLWNWCQERYKAAYPQGNDGKVVDDIEDILSIKDNESRVLRGGSFSNQAEWVRSAKRHWRAPKDGSIYVGFRPARTFTAE